MRVHWVDEQDRPAGHRMADDGRPWHFVILLFGHAFEVAIQLLASRAGMAAVQAGQAGEFLSAAPSGSAA